MPRRKKLDRPTPKMVDASIRALAAVVAAPDAPVHARVSASRALLNSGQKPDESGDNLKGSAEFLPSHAIVLPSNGREGPSFQYGFQADASVMVYRTPAELDEIEAGLAGIPLLEGPARAATSTERSRRRRERLRRERAAA